MKFNFDINKLITIGGIGLSAVEKKVEEALNARKEEET